MLPEGGFMLAHIILGLSWSILASVACCWSPLDLSLLFSLSGLAKPCEPEKAMEDGPAPRATCRYNRLDTQAESKFTMARFFKAV